jgi:hypothetical protein
VASFSTCPTREASGRPVNQRLFEDGFACGRWKLYELMRTHTAKVIGLEMDIKICNLKLL